MMGGVTVINSCIVNSVKMTRVLTHLANNGLTYIPVSASHARMCTVQCALIYKVSRKSKAPTLQKIYYY